MGGRFEVIDAFVDGERVEAAAIKRALSEDEGRDYLVDAWLLRESVQDDMAVVPAASAPRRRLPRHRPWIFAASAALVCLAAGFGAGYQVAGRAVSAPLQITGSLPGTVAPVTGSGAFPVPAATRVILVDFAASAPLVGGGD